MANGINGGLCMIYSGTYAAKTDIVGQGDATVNHQGAPIELSNKSSGNWRVNLDGSISTKAVDIDVPVTASDDASYETLVANAFAGTAGPYVFDFIEYYYEGTFTPVLQSESAAKDNAVEATIQFQSSGEVTRTPAP